MKHDLLLCANFFPFFFSFFFYSLIFVNIKRRQAILWGPIFLALLPLFNANCVYASAKKIHARSAVLYVFGFCAFVCKCKWMFLFRNRRSMGRRRRHRFARAFITTQKSIGKMKRWQQTPCYERIDMNEGNFLLRRW